MIRSRILTASAGSIASEANWSGTLNAPTPMMKADEGSVVVTSAGGTRSLLQEILAFGGLAEQLGELFRVVQTIAVTVLIIKTFVYCRLQVALTFYSVYAIIHNAR
jgi:hypothetical protein